MATDKRGILISVWKHTLRVFIKVPQPKHVSCRKKTNSRTFWLQKKKKKSSALSAAKSTFPVPLSIYLNLLGHLSESNFLSGTLHKRSKLANFLYYFMQNHLS